MNRFPLFFFLSFCVFAQDQIGFKTDRYSGVNTVSTSPTSFLDNPNPYDVNIVGVAALAQTNYAYYSDASILKLLNNTDSVFFADRSNGISGETRELVFDFSENTNKKFAFANVEVMGPSASFRFKDNKYTAGLFTKARVAVSGTRIDDSYNYYNFDDENIGNAVTIGDGKLSGMAWLEFGANFAKVYRESMGNKINVGANLKYLFGTEAAYINNQSNGTVITSEDPMSGQDVLTLNGNADIEVAYTEGLNGEENFEFQKNGSGFGLDLGISFIKKRRVGFDNPYDIEYDSKWEVNLLDVGFITFRDSYVHRLEREFNNVDNTITLPETIASTQELFQDLSFQVYGDSLQSRVNNQFTIGLPTALNIRHDRRIKENWYLNYQLTQRLPVFPNAIKRPNLIAVTPRFEKNWFGFSAPVSLFDYRRFQIGWHMRLGPLYVGTDNLLPYFFESNELDRADIYVGFKFNPFWDSEEKRRMRRPCNCRR